MPHIYMIKKNRLLSIINNMTMFSQHCVFKEDRMTLSVLYSQSESQCNLNVNKKNKSLTHASRYSILRSRVVSFSLRLAILDLQDISKKKELYKTKDMHVDRIAVSISNLMVNYQKN